MDGLTIRPAIPSDRRRLRAAVIELYEHERSLHNSHLPGEETADAYLAWMVAEAQAGAQVLFTPHLVPTSRGMRGGSGPRLPRRRNTA